MSVGSYLKTNWFILVLTVGFGAWGVYATFLTHETRDPTFVVDPNRVEILSAERAATAPIKVLRRDGSPIRGNIYAVRFYIWNAGNQSIRQENVLDSIRISLRNEADEILDYKVLKVSRPITRARLATVSPVRPVGHGLRTLAFVFSILEHNDGLSGQIIYQSNPGQFLSSRGDSVLLVSGIVEGAAAGIQNPQVPSFWSIARRHRTALAGGAAGGLLAPSLAWIVYSILWSKRKGLPFAWPKDNWGSIIRFTLFITLVLGAISAGVIGLNAWDKPPATVVSMVPDNLVP